MSRQFPRLREQVADAITFHPGNRTGTPEQRHPVSLMLADAVLRVVRPCTCDGDPIECSHEAARGQAEAERDEANRTLAEEITAIGEERIATRRVDILAVIQERDALGAAVERVRQEHTRNADTDACQQCSARDYPNYEVPWPCPTIAALDAPGGGQDCPRCEGSMFEPGTEEEEWVPGAMTPLPPSGEPCTACGGSGTAGGGR